MRPVIVGLVAAAVAGACLGFTAEWLASIGDWDREEIHSGTEAARGAAWFVTAFVVAEVVRRRAGLNAFFAVPTTCTLGATLFVTTAYTDDGQWVGMQPGAVFLFTTVSLPVMVGAFVAGHGLLKLAGRERMAAR